MCLSLCLCAFTCVYTNACAAENEDGATQDKVQVNNTQKAKRPKLHNRRPKFQSNDKIDSRRASLRMQLRRDAQAYRIDTNNQRHAAAGNDLYLAYKAAALDEDKEFETNFPTFSEGGFPDSDSDVFDKLLKEETKACGEAGSEK